MSELENLLRAKVFLDRLHVAKYRGAGEVRLPSLEYRLRVIFSRNCEFTERRIFLSIATAECCSFSDDSIEFRSDVLVLMQTEGHAAKSFGKQLGIEIFILFESNTRKEP